MIWNWILALTSAVLLVLSFPPFNIGWLGLVALTPLLSVCASEPRLRRRFAVGYGAGIVYWFGLCHWIAWTLSHHGGMGDAPAWFCFVLFCLAKAIQTGVFAALAGKLAARWYAPPAIAALWVTLEWTHSYTGFEWLNLGNAAAGMPLLLRAAPFAGVWGVSFTLALASAAIATMSRARPQSGAWLLLIPCLLLLPGLPAERKGNANAVIVQPNIDDESIWTEDFLNDTESHMRDASLEFAAHVQPAAIIVWPEVPAPFYDDRLFGGFLSGIAKDARAGILAGVVAREGRNASPLNSALLIDANGNRISRYDKVNLVPFGEFVPRPFGLITEKISTEAGDFAPGRKAVVSTLNGRKIGTFICYESAFPNYIREFADSGAEVLFNISNDSWFGKSAARYQHLLLVRMRAIENNRWIVRSTNNGVSGVIDPAGRIPATLPEYVEASANAAFRYEPARTFYTTHSDWFVLLCALIAAAALIATAVRRPGPEPLQ